MPPKLPRIHPLGRLFFSLTQKNFLEVIKLRDFSIVDYISNLLLEFAHVDNLYKIRDAQGKRIEDVGEMLLEAGPLQRAKSFEREREVRKHIGDYTLFMLGLFPEYVKRTSSSPRMDAFLDYIEVGKES